MADCDPILEEDRDHELKVEFYPPLYLQRKIWVLDVMRREGIVDVVDIGCGEGELLSALSQPAPWLGAPPPGILPQDVREPASPGSPTTPNFNSVHDPIPNLHPQKIAGLDISSVALQFAIEAITGPPSIPEGTVERLFSSVPLRWEPLTATIWKGGLQTINEEFINTECIVSSEVIEHLPPDIFPFYAPMLLGVYHPHRFLVTTPSYTFNARFTSPNAAPSVRRGFPDPTGRTDRIFRHHDHKFEWTVAEFKEWCTCSAENWNYKVDISDVGRALQEDPWGRDAELGGASLVAEFTRIDIDPQSRKDLEQEARKIVGLQSAAAPPHERLSVQNHAAHPKSRQPASFDDIGARVKQYMEEVRETFQTFESVWFEKDISIMCGGWTEVLAKAIELCDGLVLKRDESYKDKPDREAWMVELVGGPSQPRMLWPSTEDMGDHSFDFMPPDWIPVEEDYSDSSSSEGGGDEWGESTGAEGDVSWSNSEDDWEKDDERDNSQSEWLMQAEENEGWRKPITSQELGFSIPSVPQSDSSTAGWEGDESDNRSTASSTHTV